MKKDLTKLAMFGILAGFCVSANGTVGGKEIAMSKCSKDNSQMNDQKGSSCCSKSDCDNSNQSDSSSDASDCDSCSDQSDASSEMKAKRKEAAQKVVQQAE